LRPREAAGEKLASGHRLCVRLLTRGGKSLHRAKNLRHALRIIGKENGNLGANHLLARASPNGPLLAGNRTTASLENKLIEILSAHELHDLLAESELAGAKVLELRLKSTGLVI
jgi:hypothetical protein